MDRRLALTRAALAAGAFALGLAFGRPSAPLPAVAADPTGHLPGRVHDELGEAGAGARRAWRRQLVRQEDQLRAKLDELMGPEIPWPAAVPPELQPQAFEATVVDELFEHAGREPVAVDCESWPCLALYADALPYAADDAPAEFIEVRNALNRQFGKDRVVFDTEYGIHVDADGVPWNVIAVGLLPEDASDPLRQQVAARAALARLELRTDHGLVPAEL